MKNTVKIIIVVVVLFILFLIMNPFFVVKEGEQALVVRFGKIVRTETVTGLKVKMPFVDKITRYPTKIQSWDGAPKEIPTSNKQFIWVDMTARWKITDPVKFYKTVSNITQAQGKLDEIIESSTKTVITRNSLTEAVRSTNDIFQSAALNPVLEGEEGYNPQDQDSANSGVDSDFRTNLEEIKYGRKDLGDNIFVLASVQTEQFGIEIIDVVFRQIRYSDVLTRSVYDRMIAERNQMAEYYRSKGEGEKLFWLGKLEREKQSIISEAYKNAQSIKADGDAQAARIYANAYNADPEFYSFWKALESYKTVLPQMDKILTTDMDYFQFLYDPGRK